ncbi:MAG: efflux RND transporter periplasmic adaptor subunit [Myxococcota bacterium]
MRSNDVSWLSTVCEPLPDARSAVLLLAGDSADPEAEETWPAGTAASDGLRNAARAALVQRSVLVEERPASGSCRGHLRVAVPLTDSGVLCGAAAIELEDRKEDDAAAVVSALRVATRWLPPLLEASRPRSADALLVDAFAIGLEQPSARGAALALVTLLASQLECERVSVGFREAGRSRVLAISDTVRASSRSGPQKDLARAMDEAADQDATVVVPAPPTGPVRIIRAHERLGAARGSGAVCSAPFGTETEIVGVFTFERTREHPFAPAEVELCEAVAALAGSLLRQRRDAEAGPIPRARQLFTEAWQQRFGPNQIRLKLAAAVLGPVLIVLAIAPATYRVTCDATLEGQVQRAVVAGVDGFVATAAVRAGDLVEEGQVLARIDDRDVRLELHKWRGRRDQLRREHRQALADHDRAQSSIFGAQIAQAEAQLQLLEEDLTRTALPAPFDGVVIRGDLSQSLGAPVKKGDVLFEVARAGGYRIILEVDERDIADVAPGQAGSLTLSALPDRTLPLSVDRVTPVATAQDGRNHYRVEARLHEPVDTLRPGMAGIGKIDVERRRVLWIWTHRMVDWLRMWAWSWWP